MKVVWRILGIFRTRNERLVKVLVRYITIYAGFNCLSEIFNDLRELGEIKLRMNFFIKHECRIISQHSANCSGDNLCPSWDDGCTLLSAHLTIEHSAKTCNLIIYFCFWFYLRPSYRLNVMFTVLFSARHKNATPPKLNRIANEMKVTD